MSDAAVQIPEEHRSYDIVELNSYLFRRFLGVETNEIVELVVLPHGPKAPTHVAYATDYANAVRLAREGENIPRGTGVYTVANKIAPEIAARYEPNCWGKADGGRASDHEIEAVRCIYIDVDAERVKGISSTDEEKARAYDLLRRVEDFFTDRLGDDRALGRGDSGNGYSLFLAVEPFQPTKETGERIERLLKGLARKFQVDGAKIDTSVHNAARLVPCFGTVKSKGSSSKNRPHRETFFCCRPNVRRLPLEVLA